MLRSWLGGSSKGLVEGEDKISEFLTGSKNMKVYKGRAVSHLYPQHIPEETEEGWLAIGLNSGYMESCGCGHAIVSLGASSVQFSRSVVSNSLQPHELQYARPPCLSPTPSVYSTHVHRVGDAIQPSHPLSSPSPPALNLSQHQGLF